MYYARAGHRSRSAPASVRRPRLRRADAPCEDARQLGRRNYSIWISLARARNRKQPGKRTKDPGHFLSRGDVDVRKVLTGCKLDLRVAEGLIGGTPARECSQG
jgi:hypothetical protein